MDVLVKSPCCCCYASPQVHLDCLASPSLHDVTHAISEQEGRSPLHATTSAAPMDDDQGEKKKRHEEWSPPDFSMREDDMPDFDGDNGDTEVKEDTAEKPDDKKNEPGDGAAAASAAAEAEEKPNPDAEAKDERSVKPDHETREEKTATEPVPIHMPDTGVEAPAPLAEEDEEKPRKKPEVYLKFPYEDDE
eukprot:5006183-Amphidinium_carterae.1